MARKQIILELDDQDQCVYTKDGTMMWCWGDDNPSNLYQHFGYPEKPSVHVEEKIVYRDADPKPCPRKHVEEELIFSQRDGGYIQKEKKIPEQSGVSDLIRLKDAGFTIDDILQLRSDHLL